LLNPAEKWDLLLDSRCREAWQEGGACTKQGMAAVHDCLFLLSLLHDKITHEINNKSLAGTWDRAFGSNADQLCLGNIL